MKKKKYSPVAHQTVADGDCREITFCQYEAATIITNISQNHVDFIFYTGQVYEIIKFWAGLPTTYRLLIRQI